MHNTLELIQLADAMHAVRSTPQGPRPASPERAPTVRARLGRRVITLGERIAYGTSVTATR